MSIIIIDDLCILVKICIIISVS